MLLANTDGFVAVLIFLVFLPLFICAWIVFSYFGSTAGGWAALAERYRDDDPPEGKEYWMCYGKVGSIYYRSCLILRDCDSGLVISVLWVFRIGHPSLFIPWEAFHNVRQESEGFTTYTGADIGNPAVARVCLPPWLEDRIKQAIAEKAS